MDFIGIIVPIVLIALVLAIAVVVIAVLVSRRKRPFRQNHQVYQNQYPQYPDGTQTGVPGYPPQNGQRIGGPQFGGPGYPVPRRPGWVIPLIAVAVVAIVLAAVFGGILIGSRIGFSTSRTETVSSEASQLEWMESSAPDPNPTGYTAYSNSTARFSLEYPSGFEATEPNDNNVLILGDDGAFRATAEYNMSTVESAVFYNAEDLAAIFEADVSVLKNWLGVEDLTVDHSGWDKAAGLDCYSLDLSLKMDGAPYTGRVLLFDGQGDFGCYIWQCLYRTDTGGETVYAQYAEHMAESFSVDGSYQFEDWTPCEFEDPDARFLFRGEPGKYKSSSDTGYLYPVEGVFSEAAIYLRETSTKTDKTPESALETMAKYYFNNKDAAQYISQAASVPLGRYTYTEVDLSYWDDDQAFTAYILVFPRDDQYWTVYAVATEEYKEQVFNALTDVLASLRIDDDGWRREEGGLPQALDAPVPKSEPTLSIGECLDEAIDWIEDSLDYVENYTFEPLGCVDDFDGDGSQEFLASFETRSKNGAQTVSYALFTLSENGPKLLDDGILYQEVGGNGGSVGIAKGEDGVVYLTRFVKQPDGDRINNQYSYVPWKSVGTADEADSYYMEAHWTVGEEEKGTYILGDSKVDKDRLEKSRGNYTVLYELNILAGHGNGLVNGMDFDTLEQWYGD